MRLVLASANPDKAAEIARLLADAGIDVVPRPSSLPDVVEDGTTLEDNARLKAVAVCAATGEAAVADDTGLEVEALGGAPGVRSARYAGDDARYEDNLFKLLDALAELPDPAQRGARFRTVAVVRFVGGREVVAEGVCDGLIALAPQGANGFGYDPVFVPFDGNGRTFAAMTPDEKAACSHRGRAFRALSAALAEPGRAP